MERREGEELIPEEEILEVAEEVVEEAEEGGEVWELWTQPSTTPTS